MTAPKVRVDHQELTKIAARFHQRSDLIEAMAKQLRDQMEVLQGGDWIGKGANQFYAEMHGIILPTLKRLAQALKRAQDTTMLISKIMQEAEREAAALFVLDETAGARAGAFGGIGKIGEAIGAVASAVGSFPDVAMTPTPAGPIPIPYPNIGPTLNKTIEMMNEQMQTEAEIERKKNEAATELVTGIVGGVVQGGKAVGAAAGAAAGAASAAAGAAVSAGAQAVGATVSAATKAVGAAAGVAAGAASAAAGAAVSAGAQAVGATVSAATKTVGAASNMADEAVQQLSNFQQDEEEELNRVAEQISLANKLKTNAREAKNKLSDAAENLGNLFGG